MVEFFMFQVGFHDGRYGPQGDGIPPLEGVPHSAAPEVDEGDNKNVEIAAKCITLILHTMIATGCGQHVNWVAHTNQKGGGATECSYSAEERCSTDVALCSKELHGLTLARC